MDSNKDFSLYIKESNGAIDWSQIPQGAMLLIPYIVNGVLQYYDAHVKDGSSSHHQISDSAMWNAIASLRADMASMLKFQENVTVSRWNSLIGGNDFHVGDAYRANPDNGSGVYSFKDPGASSATNHTLRVGDLIICIDSASPAFVVIQGDIDETALLLRSMVASSEYSGDIQTTSMTGRNYAVSLNAAGNTLFVNVPWKDYSAGVIGDIVETGGTSDQAKVWSGQVLFSKFSQYLPLSGGTMTGNLGIGTNAILEQNNANLLGFSSGDIILGNSGRGITLESENADLYHKVGSTSYSIWDARNLPLSSLLRKQTETIDGSSETVFLADADIVPVNTSGSIVNLGAIDHWFNTGYIDQIRTTEILPPDDSTDAALGSYLLPFTNVYSQYIYEGNVPLSRKYLAQSGGSMSNTSLVTNMNADLLDSKHLTDIMADVAKSNVATATNLKVVEEKDAMFTYRNTPTAAKVAGDVLRIEEIKGNSMAWNQLVQNGDFSDGTTGWTLSDPGVVSVSNNLASFIRKGNANYISTPITLIANHKYFVTLNIKALNVSSLVMLVSHNADMTTPSGVINASSTGYYSVIFTPASSFEYIGFRGGYDSVAIDAQIASFTGIQVIDLTALPMPNLTAQEFEALYGGFHRYNPGAIKNLTTFGMKCTGLNQWDEEWEVGGYDSTTGAKDSTTNKIRSKNAIPVFPSTVYCCTGSSFTVYQYDANGAFIRTNSVATGGTFKTVANCFFIRFQCATSYGTTYRHDICINISGARNGEYEPYHEEIVYTNIGGGFNRWDGEYTVGQIKNDDTIGSSTSLGHSGYISINPNTEYCISHTIPNWNAIFFYDANKTLLSYGASSSDGRYKTLTSPSNAVYARINVFIANADSTCFNISDPSMNGTYQPYTVLTGKLDGQGESVELFTDGAMGVGTAHDLIRKYDCDVVMGEVDLGTLNWNYDSSNTRFYSDVISGNRTTLNVLCNKYPAVNVVDTNKSGIVLYAGMVFVRDTTYTDVQTFKSAMVGVHFIYPLASKKHYVFDEPLDLTAFSDALGTQSIVPSQTGMAEPTSAPIIADLKYGASAFDLMEAGGSYDEGTEDDVDELKTTPKVWSGSTLHDVFLTRDDYMLNNIAHWDQSAGGELGLLYFYSDVQVGSDSIGGDGNLTVLGALSRKVGNDILDLDNIYLGINATAADSSKLGTKTLSEIMSDVAASNVATATNLKTYTETGAMFTHRAIPAEGQHGSDMAQIRALRGNSIVWNQLIQNGDFATTDGWFANNATLSAASNTLSVTSTSASSVFVSRTISLNTSHKYYIAFRVYAVQGGDMVIAVNDTTSASFMPVAGWNTLSAILSEFPAGSDIKFYMSRLFSQVGDVCQLKDVQIFDLTAAGKDSMTADQFKAWLAEYYPGFHGYNSGTIKNLMATGVLSEGFNLWNEQYDTEAAPLYRIKSKNYCPMIGGQQYYVTGPVNNLYCYDANKNGLATIPIANNDANRLFTAPAGTCYFMFIAMNNYGVTYNHNICINLSDASRNGQYEPYRSYTMPLPITTMTGKAGGVGDSVVIYPDGMMSAGTAYDYGRVDADGWWRRTQKVLKMVNLGDLTWTYDAGTTRFSAGLSDMKIGGVSLCDRYTSVAPSEVATTDKSIALSGATLTVLAHDSAYTDADTFKTAVNGVYLIYELATSVEYVLDTPIYMGYSVDADGTETMLPDQTGLSTPTSAPICCDIQYGMTQSDIFSASRYLEGTAADIANQTAQAMAWSGATLDSLLDPLRYAASVVEPYETASDSGVLIDDNLFIGDDLKVSGAIYEAGTSLASKYAALATETVQSNPLFTSVRIGNFQQTGGVMVEHSVTLAYDTLSSNHEGLYIDEEVEIEDDLHVGGIIYEGIYPLSSKYLGINAIKWHII